jgi:hypothetical protein
MTWGWPTPRASVRKLLAPASFMGCGSLIAGTARGAAGGAGIPFMETSAKDALGVESAFMQVLNYPRRYLTAA